MQCATCKYPHSSVVETSHPQDDVIRRRRECLKCGARFTTQEKLREPKTVNNHFIKNDNGAQR